MFGLPDIVIGLFWFTIGYWVVGFTVWFPVGSSLGCMFKLYGSPLGCMFELYGSPLGCMFELYGSPLGCMVHWVV